MKYIRKDKFTKPVTPAGILYLALEKEKSSYEFYKTQAKKMSNPAMTRLFQRLESVELGHINMIKRMLEK